MSLKIELGKEGFVFCESFLNTGYNSQFITFGNEADTFTFELVIRDCIMNTCVARFRFGGAFNKRIADKIFPNRWMFLCVSFNPKDKTMSISLDGKNLLDKENLAERYISVLESVKNATLSWYHYYKEEEVTLVNIHSNNKLVEDYKCGEPGDLYAWSYTDWIVKDQDGEDRNISALVRKESTFQVCQFEYQIYVLPDLSFADALKTCSKIEGLMFFEDFIMNDIAAYPDDLDFWIPYSDELEEGLFVNTYPNEKSLNITKFFSPGQPSGGVTHNCIKLNIKYKALFDSDCENYLMSSYCQISTAQPNLKLRGMCTDSGIFTK